MTIPGQTTVYDFLDDDECALDHLSLAWAVWTLGYNAPDTASFSKSNPTHIDVPCWLATGRTSRATTTCEPSTGANGADASTCWPAGSHVKTYPSPDERPDFTADEPDSFSTSPASQMTLLAKADLFWSKTSPVYCEATVGGISRSFSRRWANSGFATRRGESWIAATSECPNDGDASSCLRDVVLEEAPPRFFLSQKAAAGILKRSTQRRKPITRELQAALEARASTSTANGLPDPLATEPAASEPRTLTASAHMSPRRLTPTEFERLQGLPDLWTVVPT